MNISPVNFSARSNNLYSNRSKNINFGTANVVDIPDDCNDFEVEQLKNLKKFIDEATTHKELFEISLVSENDAMSACDCGTISVKHNGEDYLPNHRYYYCREYDYQAEEAVASLKKDFMDKYKLPVKAEIAARKARLLNEINA